MKQNFVLKCFPLLFRPTKLVVVLYNDDCNFCYGVFVLFSQKAIFVTRHAVTAPSVITQTRLSDGRFIFVIKLVI
jgi:hypothetical protein